MFAGYFCFVLNKLRVVGNYTNVSYIVYMAVDANKLILNWIYIFLCNHSVSNQKILLEKKFTKIEIVFFLRNSV